MLSGGLLLKAGPVASSIFVNQLVATNLKSSKTRFNFQFELSLSSQASLVVGCMLKSTYDFQANIPLIMLDIQKNLEVQMPRSCDIRHKKCKWGGFF